MLVWLSIFVSPMIGFILGVVVACALGRRFEFIRNIVFAGVTPTLQVLAAERAPLLSRPEASDASASSLYEDTPLLIDQEEEVSSTLQHFPSHQEGPASHPLPTRDNSFNSAVQPLPTHLAVEPAAKPRAFQGQAGPARPRPTILYYAAAVRNDPESATNAPPGDLGHPRDGPLPPVPAQAQLPTAPPTTPGPGPLPGRPFVRPSEQLSGRPSEVLPPPLMQHASSAAAACSTPQSSERRPKSSVTENVSVPLKVPYGKASMHLHAQDSPTPLTAALFHHGAGLLEAMLRQRLPTLLQEHRPAWVASVHLLDGLSFGGQPPVIMACSGREAPQPGLSQVPARCSLDFRWAPSLKAKLRIEPSSFPCLWGPGAAGWAPSSAPQPIHPDTLDVTVHGIEVRATLHVPLAPRPSGLQLAFVRPPGVELMVSVSCKRGASLMPAEGEAPKLVKAWLQETICSSLLGSEVVSLECYQTAIAATAAPAVPSPPSVGKAGGPMPTAVRAASPGPPAAGIVAAPALPSAGTVAATGPTGATGPLETEAAAPGLPETQAVAPGPPLAGKAAGPLPTAVRLPTAAAPGPLAAGILAAHALPSAGTVAGPVPTAARAAVPGPPETKAAVPGLPVTGIAAASALPLAGKVVAPVPTTASTAVPGRQDTKAAAHRLPVTGMAAVPGQAAPGMAAVGPAADSGPAVRGKVPAPAPAADISVPGKPAMRAEVAAVGAAALGPLQPRPTAAPGLTTTAAETPEVLPVDTRSAATPAPEAAAAGAAAAAPGSPSTKAAALTGFLKARAATPEQPATKAAAVAAGTAAKVVTTGPRSNEALAVAAAAVAPSHEALCAAAATPSPEATGTAAAAAAATLPPEAPGTAAAAATLSHEVTSVAAEAAAAVSPSLEGQSDQLIPVAALPGTPAAARLCVTESVPFAPSEEEDPSLYMDPALLTLGMTEPAPSTLLEEFSLHTHPVPVRSSRSSSSVTEDFAAAATAVPAEKEDTSPRLKPAWMTPDVTLPVPVVSSDKADSSLPVEPVPAVASEMADPFLPGESELMTLDVTVPAPLMPAEEKDASLHLDLGLTASRLNSSLRAEEMDVRLDLDAVRLMATMKPSVWSGIHLPGKACPFNVRGPGYLKDRVKVPAGMSAFTLSAFDIVVLPNVVEHVARFLPSVRKSGAPFAMVINLIIPGTPLLGLVATFVTDRDCFALAASTPPEDPMDKGHGWTPFDFAFHRFMTGDVATRNRMLKLIPHIDSGNWVVRRAVGTKPVIIGKALKTTYHTTQQYIEVDIDISANSTASYITGMVRGATSGLVIDLGFVLEGQLAWELPECLIGAARVSHLDVRDAVELDMSAEIPLLKPAAKDNQVGTLQQR